MGVAFTGAGIVGPGEGSLPSLRQANERRVLEVLRVDGASSQAQIARRTGLSRATVSNITKMLQEDGLAIVRPVNGRETAVSLTSGAGAVITVEVGLTHLRGMLVSFEMQTRTDATLHAEQMPGGFTNPDAVADLVDQLVTRSAVERKSISRVCVGMHAPIDILTGMISSWAAAELPLWAGLPLQPVLEERLNLPVFVDKDANLAALAERTWGAGKDSSDFFYVTCGNGIGGALLINGNVYRGGNGLTGEIGHVVLDESGEICRCGSRGCLSTFVSEPFLLRHLQASIPRDSLEQLIDSARAGDPACQRVLAEAGRYLGGALANAAKVIAPSVIAVGGRLAQGGPLLFESLRLAVGNLQTTGHRVEIREAVVGADATLLGGVAFAGAELGEALSSIPDWMQSRAVAHA